MTYMLNDIEEAIDRKFLVTKTLSNQVQAGTIVHIMDALSNKDGSVTVNAKKLSLAELGSRLRKVAEFYPGQPLVIRADRATAYESLVAVIDTCRNAGVWNFSLATIDERK